MAAGRVVWWQEAVLYQVYPRSFADSDGDGIGDLPGITGRLGYLAGLGVDAIWLSPFYPSPMADFGYDITDHRAVDPVFGTLADFDQLLGRAHDHGVRVVVDFAPITPLTGTPGLRSRGRAGTARGVTGMCGPTRAQVADRRTTGCRRSRPPGLPGPWTRGRDSTTCTPTPAASPT
jgi:Alpha amylase, catalytic domain